ncbi:hypothetical protein CHS0354_036206 [Potamilus streckersoni]|uniref:Uncharacterized protein n=1 Tax=Potamilus streckersoni TaxID=2493646 RepID=A0AAE0SWM6_9BIVA|nr:hypothetical protein CHS0354_036206 [Potamilus streckersoni]
MIKADSTIAKNHKTKSTRTNPIRGISLLTYKEAVNKRGKISFTYIPCKELTRVRRAVKEQLFTPVLKIAEDAILESSGLDTVSLPKKALLKRVANRTRAKLQLEEPSTLDFEVNEDFINVPDFLVADIRVDGERHFLLATENQLRRLREAKLWYMDGTFKVLSEPFRQQGQLMSIIERNGAQKQLPPVFCLMSRKTKSDYLAVS